jgi:hypothetical protein
MARPGFINSSKKLNGIYLELKVPRLPLELPSWHVQAILSEPTAPDSVDDDIPPPPIWVGSFGA